MRLLRPTVVGCLLFLCVVYALTGCTRAQIEQWVDWHNTDPQAAEAFANTDAIQAALRQAQAQVHWTVNWDKVAQCESGGDWSAGLRTNSYGTFSGGLMIMQSAWRQFGGLQFAPYAGAASKAEQIVVAERIAARVGAARAWQCPV